MLRFFKTIKWYELTLLIIGWVIVEFMLAVKADGLVCSELSCPPTFIAIHSFLLAGVPLLAICFSIYAKVKKQR